MHECKLIYVVHFADASLLQVAMRRACSAPVSVAWSGEATRLDTWPGCLDRFYI